MHITEKQNILSIGLAIVRRNKRYVIWFYLLNLIMAWMGTVAFRQHAGALLDHSLYSNGLVQGFDLGVLTEMLARPEFGPVHLSAAPAMTFAALFFLLTMIFLPGVFLGYASDHRISREEFYRTCGRNVWRFVRLTILFAIFAGIVAGILGGIQNAVAKAADESSYEKLLFYVNLFGYIVIFLALTVVRIWFDLAEADVVITDQRAVRRSVGKAYRQTRASLGRVFGAYLVISVVALLMLAIGLWLWYVIVPPTSVFGAFLISQLILLLLLTTRFWQRAVAVSFHSTAVAEPSIENLPAPVSFMATSTPQAGGI